MADVHRRCIYSILAATPVGIPSLPMLVGMVVGDLYNLPNFKLVSCLGFSQETPDDCTEDVDALIVRCMHMSRNRYEILLTQTKAATMLKLQGSDSTHTDKAALAISVCHAR